MLNKSKVVFLFPGQGAQYIGMGKDFYDTYPAAKEIFLQADKLLKRPFSQLIFEGNKEELTQTKNSQLAIYIVSLAVHAVLRQEFPSLAPTFCVGLSLGEYTALVASGKLSFEEGLFLVEKRALFMQEACEANPSSMRVILGMDPEKIEEVLKNVGTSAWVANLNCPGQVVIGGTLEGLEKASTVLKEAGARRVLPLDVSGAFHTELMKSAQEKLTPDLMKASLKDTEVNLVMNTPGSSIKDLGEIRRYLIEQVTQPVYYQKGIESILAGGGNFFIEMGPGKVLQGINKKMGVTFPTFSIEKSDELQEFIKLQKEETGSGNA